MKKQDLQNWVIHLLSEMYMIEAQNFWKNWELMKKDE